MNAFVRIFESKAGKRCAALVVKYAGGTREKLLFSDAITFMQLLDLKPTEFYDLAYGEYPIV